VSPELYEEELAALRAERNQRLAASEKLTAAYEQQERIACQVNVELTELLTATEKAATDFRARVEAEFGRLRENLVADAEAMASHGSGTSADTIRDAIDAAHKRLMGGGA